MQPHNRNDKLTAQLIVVNVWSGPTEETTHLTAACEQSYGMELLWYREL
jgi:hypothetical protein